MCRPIETKDFDFKFKQQDIAGQLLSGLCLAIHCQLNVPDSSCNSESI